VLRMGSVAAWSWLTEELVFEDEQWIFFFPTANRKIKDFFLIDSR
jgi:hypothetical protein